MKDRGDPLDRVDGRAKVTGTARYAAEVPVARAGERTYRGRWNPGRLSETVLARLVLRSGADAVESTHAAVHFHEILEQATPSRRTASWPWSGR